MPDLVQEQVVHDAPPPVPVIVPTVTLPADAVMSLLNVLEALVPTHGGLPTPQTTSQAQAQVQLNVVAPQMAPLQVVQPVANTGQSKDLKNFMDLKPPEFDDTHASIEPQKFIQRCEKILTTLGMKETRGVEFSTFLFSGSAESWWNSTQRSRRAGLPPITWSEFSAMFMDRFVPLSKRDNMRHEHEKMRRFVDGLEHRYHSPVVRDIRGDSYEEVVDTALRYESYQERDKTDQESKRDRSTDGFSGAPSRGKSGFNRGQSRPIQSEPVVQSSRSSPDLLNQSQWCSLLGVLIQLDRGSNRYRGGIIAHISQKGDIAKYCTRGNSSISHATPQPQRMFTGTQTQTQSARATPQVDRGQGRQGAQAAQGHYYKKVFQRQLICSLAAIRFAAKIFTVN
ncbi:uncharacterized protein [Nicotiana tomentosiformis]|uniref:uncharacterized protein n=1 Tax=Nicotiana tomentosiformis TaxID=4098 RepID=UPI00388CEB1A